MVQRGSFRNGLRPGFTIIELLVVIVIIGLLTALATTSYVAAQTRSRDTARKSTVNSIATAVETYYDQNHTFPGDAPITQASPPSSTYYDTMCEGYTNLGSSPSPNQYPYYFYSPAAMTNSGCSGSTVTSSNDSNNVATNFQPTPDWIPGLGQFLNPIPTESHYQACDGTQGSGSSYDIDYLDSVTQSGCAVSGDNQLMTYIYRNLGNGYAIYTRLEDANDVDFAQQYTATTTLSQPKCGTASTMTPYVLNNDTTGGDLPVMPVGLNLACSSSSNLVVYMVRK
jgi:prepilin-type N-terminal cleavage/methylation domain-containing protein